MSFLGFERVDDPATQRNFDRIDAALGVLAQIPVFILDSGTPEHTVTASPPAACYVRAGGSSATLYLKATGADTNTGWEKVSTSP